ncbi:hypothetical protein GY45DRAFT_1070050 [Cubamyces sp. BRFM 1775]|nr:hypothetical protein GY45DRAFT_1070050 [Cubamyces sp. BRFM 1775]
MRCDLCGSSVPAPRDTSPASHRARLGWLSPPMNNFDYAVPVRRDSAAPFMACTLVQCDSTDYSPHTHTPYTPTIRPSSARGWGNRLLSLVPTKCVFINIFVCLRNHADAWHLHQVCSSHRLCCKQSVSIRMTDMIVTFALFTIRVAYSCL